MLYPRFYQNLSKYLKANKVLVIYGPRQVGKTTLLKNFLSQTKLKYKLDSGDSLRTQQILSSQDFEKITQYLAGYQLYALDEAQKVPRIGLGLKIIVDQIPGIKVIATGSSSFTLSGQVGEPLTGRKRTLTLFPLSQIELNLNCNSAELKEKVAEVLVFGGYPTVMTASPQRKIAELEEIVNSYLFNDLFELEGVKASKVIVDLSRLIAFQVGSEVSLSELGQQLGIDAKTVGRYLDLLEKSFVLFNLRGYSRNLRTEITKKSKYYFWDNGIRNAVIANYNPLELRNDVGTLWENFLVSERLKAQEYRQIHANNYFWRTWEQKEVDWLEEREGKVFAYEFKYAPKKLKPPNDFLTAYPGSEFKVITSENYQDFVL